MELHIYHYFIGSVQCGAHAVSGVWSLVSVSVFGVLMFLNLPWRYMAGAGNEG